MWKCAAFAALLAFAVPLIPAGGIRFREVARSAGIQFVHQNHPTPRKHLIETVAGGVAAFDYNNDGRIDLFFTNGAAIPSLEKEDAKYWNRLYRNDGGMKFTDVTTDAGLAGGGYSMGAAAADFDHDGFVDLFVAGTRHNVLYRNTGNGRFENVTARAGIGSDMWSVAAGWFDYDNDGRLDLFVVNYVEWSPDYDRFCGDQSRGIRVYCHPKYFKGLPNRLYRNRGDGTFEDVSKKSGIAALVGRGMSVAFADYDDDGWVDAFVSNDNLPNFLFHNRGNGTFEEVGLLAGVAVPESGKPVSSMGVDFRDYDNDGRPDIIVTALAGETFPTFRNEGNGFFRDVTYVSGIANGSLQRSGWSIGLVDFDNDGWKDLFTANGHVNDRIEEFEAHRYRLPNSVFANTAGKFRDVSATAGEGFDTPKPHRGSAFADFDGDGRIDVAVAVLGSEAELWQNVTPGSGRWLVLRLAGTRSNRDAIGARVRAAGQTNLMTSSVGYASSSQAGVHFGLGNLEKVGRVEIRWPGGKVQTLENVETNRIVNVTEPKL
jgi:hypothetical protein